MIRVTYLLCVIGAPERCEENAFVVNAAPLPAICASLVQADLARRVRPGWRLARWRCAPAQRRAPPDHDFSGRPPDA